MFEIIIRQADDRDQETIVAFNAAMAWETEKIRLDAATLLSGVRAVLDNAALGMYFVGELDGRIVGQLMITFEWSDWRNGCFWWIQSVYVTPDARRGGVFRALHGHVRALAEADPGVCGLRLYVHHDNERAMDAYRRLGMTPTEYRLFEEDWSGAAGEH